MENASGSQQGQGQGQGQGPWVLTCPYCMWTSLDVGIKFDKPTSLRAQLSKMTGDSTMTTPKGLGSGSGSSSLQSKYSSVKEISKDDGSSQPTSTNDGDDNITSLNPQARFSALKSFYRNQIAETSTSTSDPWGNDYTRGRFTSGTVDRIMSMYTSTSTRTPGTGSSTGSNFYIRGKKSRPKPPIMREAISSNEGIIIPKPDADDSIIRKMVSDEYGWDGLASIEQRISQFPRTRFVDDLLPIPMLLRTKRAKRCKTCKHILVKPESKPQSTRFRMRLIALSFIPLPTLRPLVQQANTGLSSATAAAISTPNLDSLSPLKPIQFLLTLKNHMFDPVRITLATPPVTPGAVSSRVTILCPQFDIGPNKDTWDEADEALQEASKPTTTRTTTYEKEKEKDKEKDKAAEAGKVFEKGQNWSTIALEVVPGLLPDRKSVDNIGIGRQQQDEDVLEIPVFVHMEWDSENQIEQPLGGGGSGGGNKDTVKRELAYWMVLGVGRIGSMSK